MMQTPEWLRTEDTSNPGREKVHWWRLIGLAIGGMGVIMFLTYLISGMGGEEEKKTPEKTSSRMEQPNITFDAEAAEAAEAEAVAETRAAEEEDEEKKEEEQKEDPRIAILANLGKERIQPYQMDHDRVAKFQEFAGAAGGSCDIMPGAIAKLRLLSAMNTDNGGAVRAVLAEPVPGQNDCIALNMGAMFVGMVDTGVKFGQGRANIVFTAITDGDRAINIEAPAGDAMGSGGVPGRVNRHIASKAGGVALATSVDLAGFAFMGAGGGFGIILGNSGRVIDDIARQFVNRPNTITRDPTKEPGLITVTFMQKVSTGSR